MLASNTGAHLRLPGPGDDRPTLEIFQYSSQVGRADRALNRPGFGHIVFQVADVSVAHAEVMAHGGRPVGEIGRTTTPAGRPVTWC